MAMNPEVAAQINDLKNDRLHGAGWLSRQAINIVNSTIKESKADTIDDFLEESKLVAGAIMLSRPTMVSIANYVSQLLKQIIRLSREQTQLDALVTHALTQGNQLIEYSENAAIQVAERGAVTIGNRDTVITCSYSSIVSKAFEIAKRTGTSFQVIVAESKNNEIAYGEISARQIKEQQIKVTLVSDSKINSNTRKSNMALVGADTVLFDGSLINGTPTLRLARAAEKAGIPFYSVCETAKFDIQRYRSKQSKHEPGFDITPPYLITGFITEMGIIEPARVSGHTILRQD